MINVYLKKNEEKRILGGEALVYANEIFKIENKDKNGSLANLYAYDGRFIGKGYINFLSKILLRVILRDENKTDDADFFFELINRANEYRRLLGYDDGPQSSYRAFFSEADGLSGLIVDKYADTLVVEISSLGVELKKPLIIDTLVRIFHPAGIYEKCEMNLRTKEGLPDTTGVLYGTVAPETLITENGLTISVDIPNGQKTGYFLDQKENRLALRRYTAGKEVLDCFSNTGGFSINAAVNASRVYSVDISERATDNVLRNAALNGFTNIEVITDDVFEVLRRFRKENRLFDVIVLDPPAFTKSVSEIKDALKGYLDINVLALKLVKHGGFLVSSSCSQHVTFDMFKKMLLDASRMAKRPVKLVEFKTQAPDHAPNMVTQETEYLKFFVLYAE